MGTPAPSVLLLVLWDPSRAAAGVAAPAARRWRWRDERRWKEGRRWLKRHYDGRGGERVFGCCGDCLTCGAKPAAVSSPTGGRAPHAPARYIKGGESLPVEREKVRVSSQADTGVPERRRLRARLSRCAPVGVVVGARSDARRLGGLVPNRQWEGGGEARGARSLPSPHCPTTPALVSATAAEAVGRPRSWSPCLALQGRVGIPLSLSLSPAFTRLPPPSPDDDLPQTERRPNRPCCCATLGCLSLGALLSTVPKHAHLFVTHRRDRGRDRGRGRSVLRLVGTGPSSAGLRGRDHGGGCVPV